MDPVLDISIERQAPDRYQVAWGPAFCHGAVDIGWSVGDGAWSRICDGAEHSAELHLPAAPARALFLLEPRTADPAIVVGERYLAFNGGVNFRDLGGYATADGRRLRWGRLYRSGHMSNLDATDFERLAGLGITAVCDFRLAEERANENAELPGDPALHVLGIMPGVGDKEFFPRLFASSDDPQDVVDAMHRMMASLVRDAAPNYLPLFRVLGAAPAGATLLNCSAGKERTGVASALLLAALGVPRETIMYDFMLSGRYFPAAAEVPRVLEKYRVRRRGKAGEALIMPLLETRESYLATAFAAIDEDFGSVDQFLLAHYGLDAAALARLRDHYTE